MFKTRICAAEMAVRYAALAEKYMCVIVIRYRWRDVTLAGPKRRNQWQR